MKLSIKQILIVILITIIHFFITFLGKFEFNEPHYYFQIKFLFYKAISFILIFCFWYLIFFIKIKIQEKNVNWIQLVINFCIFFGISIVFLVISWPGIWIWDEFFIYETATWLELLYWQNYLSSVFHIISLMILPFATGIVICQLFIIALILTFISHFLPSKYRWVLVLLLCLPPVIHNNLTPIRATLFSYLLLFVISYFYFYLNKLEKLKIVQFVPLFFAIPIIVIWKSEGIVLLPFLLILIFLISKNKLSWKKIVTVYGILLGLIFCFNKPQHKWAKENYSLNNEYTATVFLNPLSMMIHEKDLNKLDELRPRINKYINLSVLYKYPDFTENTAYWIEKDSLFVSSSIEDYKVFQNAFVRLVLANPTIYLKYRWKTFEVNSGLINDQFRRKRTAIFDDKDNAVIQKFTKKNEFTKVLFPKCRNTFLNIIEGSKLNNTSQATIVYFLGWNLMITIVMLCFLFMYSIIKKQLLLLVIILMLMSLFLTIFFTAPASYFMYYFPIYLICSFMFFNCVFVRSR